MAKFKEMAEAMAIFAKHKPDTYLAGAEHDILYVIPFDEISLSPEEEARLEELGFHRSTDSDGWAIFV